MYRGLILNSISQDEESSRMTLKNYPYNNFAGSDRAMVCHVSRASGNDLVILYSYVALDGRQLTLI